MLQVELGANLRFSTTTNTKNGFEKMSLQSMLSSFRTLKNVPKRHFRSKRSPF